MDDRARDDSPPFRLLPQLTDLNRPFWQGGEQGQLVFLRCQDCGYYLHPPAPVCPRDWSRRVAPEAVSGRATVVSFTVNHQPWMPGPELPYVIGLVAIPEQPELRLTTNLVNCRPEDVHIGLPVRVCFEHHPDAGGDVWLPLFEPDPAADSGRAAGTAPAPDATGAGIAGRPAAGSRRARGAPATDGKPEASCAITGLGQSAIGRRLHRNPLELTIDACLAAIDDAGLTPAQINGLSTYPGGLSMQPGFSGAGAYEVLDALRLDVDWYDGGVETSGQLGSIVKACLAVAGGMADHVLCFRSVWEGSAQAGGRGGGIGGGGGGGRSMPRASGPMEWTLPFSAASAACWIALYAQAHMERYGTTSDQLAQVAINARKNAARNPAAIYREPMSLDDYRASRVITTPLRLYDCDVPCDGATAVVVSRRDAAADLRRPPVLVEALGAAIHDRPSWDQLRDLTRTVGADAAAQMWSRTDLSPSDVDVAQLYDGFSILTLLWLEALRFCPPGESGRFVEGGTRIALDGELPLNTAGGQLSGGRLHGYGLLHEACLQLRGDAGDRQVAAGPEVAVAAAGGGNTCGCLLLTRAR